MKLMSRVQSVRFLFFVGLVTLATTGLGADQSAGSIRIATYNASLYGKEAGEVLDRLSGGKDRQARDIAAVVQTVRPDILLINEIDYDVDSQTARALNDGFFAKSQNSLKRIDYPYIYSVPSNTGVDSKLDLNNNRKLGEPNDSWGYGVYPGQYSMAVFSRFPFDEKQLRSFQQFLWNDLPAASRPEDPDSGESFFDDNTWKQLRLSSKNHIDLPIRVSDSLTIHLLASHPTPPVFDGPEDRNGHRNHDEIRFWSVYLSKEASNLADDQGRLAALPADAKFVIMGDLNSDPVDGDSRHEAIKALIDHSRVQDPLPSSIGAVADAKGNKASEKQSGNPAHDTANFGRNGNLRVDYVLPSRNLTVTGAGVFWPPRGSAQRLMIAASDHRLVWIDIEVP